MSPVYFRPQIPCVGNGYAGLLTGAVFPAGFAFMFESELQYTDEPGGLDSKGGGHLKSGIGLLSYPMSDHLKTPVGGQPASSLPCAGGNGWTRRGGL